MNCELDACVQVAKVTLQDGDHVAATRSMTRALEILEAGK